MSRLTELAGVLNPKNKGIAAHQFRRLGDCVLVSDDAGRFAILSQEQYREFLGGLEAGHPLREKLGASGLLRDGFDFEKAAELCAQKSLLSWRGPCVHIVRLGAGARLMSLETARQVVDFIFTAPGPCVNIELQVEEMAIVWGLVWFIVEHSQRKSEWSRRPLTLTLRTSSDPSLEQAKFLKGRRVELRADMRSQLLDVMPGARRARILVVAPAQYAAECIDRLVEAKVESVLFLPGSDRGQFLTFYAAAIDRMIELEGRADICEERALGLLSAQHWLLPGHDLLAELCFTPDGGIYSSELAAQLEGDSQGLLRLGEVPSARYADFASSPVVQAILAASLAENQGMCSQCVYRPFCAIPPAENLRSQATLWGQHPASASCALSMGILDILFSRLANEKPAAALRRWFSQQ